MLEIVKNTYPSHVGCARGEVGDVVEWRMARGRFELVKQVGEAVVYASSPVTRDGMLVSNGKRPALTGVIAQVKSRGWFLEVADGK